MCSWAQSAGKPVQELPSELKKLDIKGSYISSSFKRAGRIHALTGSVVVVHKATKEAYFGRKGDYIHENDSLHTLAESRCRIKFFNEDIVTMAKETEFSVDSFQDDRITIVQKFIDIICKIDDETFNLFVDFLINTLGKRIYEEIIPEIINLLFQLKINLSEIKIYIADERENKLYTAPCETLGFNITPECIIFLFWILLTIPIWVPFLLATIILDC